MALPSKKTSSPLLEGETLGARVLRNRLLGVRKEERLSSSRKEREWSLLLDALEGIARKPLYRAKENGRNQYVFCDHLRRFEQSVGDLPAVGGIEASTRSATRMT